MSAFVLPRVMLEVYKAKAAAERETEIERVVDTALAYLDRAEKAEAALLKERERSERVCAALDRLGLLFRPGHGYDVAGMEREIRNAVDDALAADDTGEKVRFLAKVAVGKPDDCWLWIGGRSEPNGYGACWFRGRRSSSGQNEGGPREQHPLEEAVVEEGANRTRGRR